MGRRGPAPAPAAIKLLRGETRPSRVNYEAPLPRQRAPVMPRGMEDAAQKVWRRVMREMGDADVILAADTDVLRVYCEAVASYVRTRGLLIDSGPIIRGTRGRDVVINPLSRLVREEREAIRLLARELGLSPAARAGLRIDVGGSTGDMEDVLGPPTRLRVLGHDDTG